MRHGVVDDVGVELGLGFGDLAGILEIGEVRFPVVALSGEFGGEVEQRGSPVRL